jgi:hypothetical protein
MPCEADKTKALGPDYPGGPQVEAWAKGNPICRVP